MDAFEALRRVHRPGEPCVFLDGVPEAAATPADREVRAWSAVAAAPAGGLCVREGRAWRREGAGAWAHEDGDAWALLRAFVREAQHEGVEGAPFPYGVAGLVSYDAGRLIERIPSLAQDDAPLPELLFFRFDALVFARAGEAPRVTHRAGAEDAAEVLRARLAAPPPPLAARGAPAPIVPRTPQADFEEMVRRGKRHVREGDVFQVNLSHRLETTTRLDPIHLYARLREANPAPFSGYLQSGALPEGLRPFHVLSSSPERLFRLDGRRLEARPIAGTRRRDEDAARDAGLAKELRDDPKEQAEHVMLVDLARNDLGRVARFGSVRVPRLLSVETYRTVHHLVSVVEAELDEGRDAVDALVALFPGGTITGAPKVRAMEVIESLEPVRRGVYTGSLGWFGPGGACDFNILIRTLLVREAAAGRAGAHPVYDVHLQVGAGIVEDSDPEREYQETLAKAQGLLRALRA